MDEYVRAVLTRDPITGNHTTVADAYAAIQVGGANSFKIRGYQRKSILFKAETKDLKFQIEGSHDDTEFVILETDIVVVVGTNIRRAYPTHTIMGEVWNYLKISVKPNAAGQNGKGTFQFEGSSL